MKKTIETKCQACNGKGFRAVKQPAKPGRRIYPPPCKACGGKGRITKGRITSAAD
jgi:DnaJ-class molecular chaperone